MTKPNLDSARQFYQQGVGSYEAKRAHKARWRVEHENLASMLKPMKGTILDVPVGTGRFLQLYKDLGLSVIGVDYNEAMLAQARRKHPDVELERGDIIKLGYPDGSLDIVVSVRFLHLITPDEVPLVMRELLRVAKHHVIVTAPLAKASYVKGRSQIHTMDTIQASVHHPWEMLTPVRLLEEKGIAYYMLHFRRG